MSISSVSFQGPRETDKGGVSAFFQLAAVLNPEKSEEAGHDVFEDVEQVVMLLPKDNKTRPVLRATEKHKARFPRAWQAFKDRVEDVALGTPLANLTGLTPAEAASYRAGGVASLEHLVALDPTSSGKRFGPRLGNHIAAARKYLERNQAGEKVDALAAENEKLKERLAALEAASKAEQEAVKAPAKKAA